MCCFKITDGKFVVEVAKKQIENDFQNEPNDLNKAKELLDACATRGNIAIVAI